jgi:hypothetical protein
MVLVFGLVGLIVGILVGLFNPAGSGRDPGLAVSDRRGETVTTREGSGSLPASFYTVVLASVDRGRPRAEVDARAATYRNQGIDDVEVLDPARWSSLAENFWAICSGVFDTQREAADHLRDLRGRFPNLGSAYLKPVNNES